MQSLYCSICNDFTEIYDAKEIDSVTPREDKWIFKIIELGSMFQNSKTHFVCYFCFELTHLKPIPQLNPLTRLQVDLELLGFAGFGGREVELDKKQYKEFENYKDQIIKDSKEERKSFIKLLEDSQDRKEQEIAERTNLLENDIISLLKKHSTKMSTSDIDAHLKHQNVDEIKKLCEEMYHGGKISRTANYRYFILSDEKKKPPKKTAAKKPKPRKTSAPKTDSVADEIKKFADLKDQGILTQEEFDAKKKELLG